MTGRLLGYAVASRRADDSVWFDYSGDLEPTPEAAGQWAVEPGDFVVAVSEVTP